MNCKYCGGELEEGVTLCPNCGAENDPQKAEEPAADVPAAEDVTAEEASATEAPEAAEPVPEEQAPAEEPVQPEQPKKKPLGKIILAAVAGVAVIAVLVCVLVMTQRNQKNPSADGDTTAVTAEPGTIPTDGNPDDETCKGSYTVSDEEAVSQRDVVVATMGDCELTNGQLQVYYWMQVYNFYKYYGSYLSNFNLDLAQPLDTQTNVKGTGTWQQMFLSMALESWHQDQSLTLLAEKESVSLSQEDQQSLDGMEESLKTSAENAGYASVDDMLAREMGAGCKLDDYLKYTRLYFYGSTYYSAGVEKLNPTDSQVESYYQEHSEEYAQQGIEKNATVVDVRHILIAPEGGTTDDDGNTTYSDEEWEACRAKAQALLDQWEAGDKTEDSFAALATENSEDPGSKSNGGLYEQVQEGKMVTEFNDWCFDASRKPGDTGLVKTKFGYHIMYFVDSMEAWRSSARADLLSEMKTKLVEDAMSQYPMTVDYSKIVLAYVDLVSEN